MAPSREIEKLQRRWQENPLGLTFAPLAEAYRKEGMFADALELLDIGLSQHPGYVPAHIVKGRCFLDTGADSDAERSFVRVTDLDPENVIALKSLAEIAERSGRVQEAIDRLERLLEFDRSNEEARLQLDQLRALHPAPAGVAEPDVPSPAPPVAAEVTQREQPTSAPETPRAEPELEPAEAVAASELPRAEIVDLDRSDLEVTPFNPLELTAASAAEEALVDQEVPVATGAEPAEGVEREPEEPSEPAGESPAERITPASAAPAEAEPAEPELVVTETMAELFLRQGHRELALAVYTQLASREPGNLRIRAAIDRMEAEHRPTPSLVLPAYAAVLTGGQSVRAYFEQLLAERRPDAPRQDRELSLGSVFGDERGGAATPTGAIPDPSYDEFFADSAEQAVAPDPGSPPDEPTGQSKGASPVGGVAGAGDDLEGFTDWLRGLRR
jgi:tetratricopeptide (TPR) repeat protein